MENRTPEEELEYRRYLIKRIRMRKRRRKVMIARTIVVIVVLVLVFFLFYGIGRLTGPIGGSSSEKKTVAATAVPTQTPLAIQVPKGYEKIYEKLEKLRGDYREIDDILVNLDQYPKDLLRLLIHNQETVTFVSNYLKHVDDEEVSGSITEEELSQTIPLFQQWDQRWGYVKYGNNIIAINGCGPTCMSMVYTGLTQKSDKTPADIAELCMDNDYYTTDSGTSWILMSEGAKKLNLTPERISVGKNSIEEALKAGKPVICSMKPGDFTDTGHFIVLRGISDSGKLILNDPNSIERSQKEWKVSTVLKQIKAAWSYSYNN